MSDQIYDREKEREAFIASLRSEIRVLESQFAAANKEIEELKQKYLRILDYVLTYSNDPAIVRVAKAALHEKGGTPVISDFRHSETCWCQQGGKPNDR